MGFNLSSTYGYSNRNRLLSTLLFSSNVLNWSDQRQSLAYIIGWLIAPALSGTMID